MFNEHHLRAEFDYRTEVLQRTSSIRRHVSDLPPVVKPSSRPQRLSSMLHRWVKQVRALAAETPVAVDGRSESRRELTS